jgi:protein transport protein SEC23
LVGLVTFGTNVQVHELGFEGLPKAYVIRGNKEYGPAKVGQLLGCAPATGAPAVGQQKGAPPPPPGAPGQQHQMPQQTYEAPGEKVLKRFLLPVSECSMTLESILDDLRKDPWPVPTDKRVARCTGCALSVATSLLDLALPRRGARVMMFVGGPCTSGPGAIVSRLKSDDLRSHADLARNAEPLHKPACQFYASLAKRHNVGAATTGKSSGTAAAANASATSCHVVDVFACSLDQVGVLEMGELVEATGGLMVLGDSFGQSVFKESLRRVFQTFEDDIPEDGGKMQMAFGATLEVLTSREFKVSGAIGPVTSLGKKGPNVSDLEVGRGGTNAWSLGGIDPNTTIAVYFDITNPGVSCLPAADGLFCLKAC